MMRTIEPAFALGVWVFRSNFLTGLLTSGAVFASTGLGRADAPSPAASANPYERCDRNYVIPYNQPLEIKHRALDAPDIDLQAYRGSVVVLNFFATWCGPCNAEQSGVVEVANTYYGQGLRMIGINYKEADDRVRKYRDKYKMVYPIIMDDDGGLFDRVENNDVVATVAFPVTLFLNENGELTCYRRGAMHKEELVYKVERMLSFMHGSACTGTARTIS